MEQYILDTNICIALLKNQYHIREMVNSVGLVNCHISILTIGELYYGAYKSTNIEKHLKDVDLISNLFDKVFLSDSVMDRFGEIKAVLSQKGLRIDDMDLLIGASATSNDFTLVTDNVKHLERIPEIKITNWIKRE